MTRRIKKAEITESKRIEDIYDICGLFRIERSPTLQKCVYSDNNYEVH